MANLKLKELWAKNLIAYQQDKRDLDLASKWSMVIGKLMALIGVAWFAINSSLFIFKMLFPKVG